VRFNACSRKLLVEENANARRLSIGEHLKREGYSAPLRNSYLIVRVWQLLDFPFFLKILAMFPAHGSCSMEHSTGRV